MVAGAGGSSPSAARLSEKVSESPIWRFAISMLRVKTPTRPCRYLSRHVGLGIRICRSVERRDEHATGASGKRQQQKCSIR